MNRRFGPMLVGTGLIIFVIGMMGVLEDEDGPSAAPTTIAGPPESSTPAVSVTSIATPTTSSSVPSTTTTSHPASTTTSSTSTSTTVPNDTVESFVEAFSIALDQGDRAFVFGRLHPVVIDSWGEELCSAWVDREIMALGEYSLEGPPDGPSDHSVSTPAGTVTVPDYYTAPVSFTFEGQPFEAEGTFATIGPEMYWLGQCR